MHIFVPEMKKLKKIPEFKNEDEEREFWAKNDSSEYLNWEKSEKMVFPNLKPSSKQFLYVCRNTFWMKLKCLPEKGMCLINR
jgi:hypothetical protein